MEWRISGSACFKIRLTTFAGISSTISAASSTYNSSRTSFSSLSEKLRISSSWASGSISTKVSAASSLGSRRYISGICFSSSPSNSPATSLGFMVMRMSRSVAYFLSSNILRTAFSTISKRSAMISLLYFNHKRQSYRAESERAHHGARTTSARYIAISASIHGVFLLVFIVTSILPGFAGNVNLDEGPPGE